MPLKLITGPANANKARAVLDGVREAATAGRSPLLVVPTTVDADRFRRELAADITLGFAVVTFTGLEGRMAERAALGLLPAPEPLAELAAGVAARRLAAEGRLEALAHSAATRGFAVVLAELAGELAAAGAPPGDFAAIASRWAASDPDRAALARDLASLYGAQAEQLDRSGYVEPVAHAVAVSRTLNDDPSLWGGSPVFLYGFDDLTDEQLDAVEALAAGDGVDVTVSLPYEPGRLAFAGRRRAYERLASIGTEEALGPEPADGPGAAARELHEVERRLLEPAAKPVQAAGGIEFMAGGDERAELELVASRILELAHDGVDGVPVPLEEIAVAVRDVRGAGPLVAQVLGDAGIPVALERWVRASETSTGRALAALLRLASGEGSADDVVAWLRAPGLVRASAVVDTLEARIRRAAVVGPAEARRMWEELVPDFPLDAIDEVADALQAGPAELCAELAAKARRLVRAPWGEQANEGDAPVFGPERELDARAAAGIVERLDVLAGMITGEPSLQPGPAEIARLVFSVEVRSGDGGRQGAVRVASPLAIRASRVQALFLCRMNQGIFPSAGSGRSLLSEAARASLARATGFRLDSRQTTLDDERYLLYASVSRPTALLVASWHEADGDGAARLRSPFVDDLRAVLVPEPAVRRRSRGEARWVDGGAIGPRQARVAQAAAGPAPAEPDRSITEADVLAQAISREAWSATAIEKYHQCPVRWMVESLLRPEPLDPEAHPLVRGRVVHAALQGAFSGIGRPLDPEGLAGAIDRATDALVEAEAREPLAGDDDRRAIARARLLADVIGLLGAEALAGRQLVPDDDALEFGFGPGTDEPAVDLGDGLVLSGRFDRVDRKDGQALIIDYKGRGEQPGWAQWREQGRLQAGLYALAWEKLHPGEEVVGALYQQVGNKNAARGFMLDESADGALAPDDDRLTREELESLLSELRASAVAAVEGIEAGRIEPRPQTCTPRGGCAYPAICRCRR